MNFNPLELQNSYFSLRHGRSNPNEQGIIISDHLEGQKEEHGLTRLGRKQIANSIRSALRQKLLGEKKIVIASSRLSRAKQGTIIARDILETETSDEVILEYIDDMRERYFGIYEGQSNVHYPKIWNLDAQDSSHETDGVESPDSVLKRKIGIINYLEAKYRGVVVLLSGHGDPLQMTETWFRDIPVSQHRTLKPLENAELRPLNAPVSL